MLERELIQYLEDLRLKYENADTYQKADKAARHFDSTLYRLIPELIKVGLAYWDEKR